MILDEYRIKSFKETPLMDKFNELVKIVANSYENDEFRATLLLI